MDLDILTAVSPIDGRYRGKTEPLAPYFSEYALMKYRVRVEIEYFITLCELPLPQLAAFDHALFPTLRKIYEGFSEEDASRVKDIEKVTNHDVKAIEYFIKEQFDAIGGLDAFKEFSPAMSMNKPESTRLLLDDFRAIVDRSANELKIREERIASAL